MKQAFLFPIACAALFAAPHGFAAEPVVRVKAKLTAFDGQVIVELSGREVDRAEDGAALVRAWGGDLVAGTERHPAGPDFGQPVQVGLIFGQDD